MFLVYGKRYSPAVFVVVVVVVTQQVVLICPYYCVHLVHCFNPVQSIPSRDHTALMSSA